MPEALADLMSKIQGKLTEEVSKAHEYARERSSGWSTVAWRHQLLTR